ncbi:MAG: hypothetical protein S4CHLAM45_03800 [Chlamydiales bacterium]|nr:hypothetical protein [Chlamydiales bacterium]MCH9619234.1 hypothetical protein [Chlamydiales bacterium]MCH9622496.1 hypothetical protein [Chlamydiales bacterium]
MPRKKRIIIIIHLCFAFSYLFWILIHPFIKEVVIKKSEAILFESVVGNETLFATLPIDEQSNIREGYQKNALRKQSYGENFSLSFFGVVWMLLSITLSFFLLFSISGASNVCWILPMIVIAYGFFLGSAPPTQNPEFFPTQKELTPYLVENSGKKSREKIIDGWNTYLIHEWLHETPVDEQYDDQVARGNFLFNVERVRWLLEEKRGDVTLAHALFTPSALQFIFYLGWNLLFAWQINRRSKSEVPLSVS